MAVLALAAPAAPAAAQDGGTVGRPGQPRLVQPDGLPEAEPDQVTLVGFLRDAPSTPGGLAIEVPARGEVVVLAHPALRMALAGYVDDFVQLDGELEPMADDVLAFRVQSFRVTP